MGARELGGLRGDGVGAGYLIDRSAGVLVSSWGEKCFRKQGGGGVGRGPYPFFGGGGPRSTWARGRENEGKESMPVWGRRAGCWWWVLPRIEFVRVTFSTPPARGPTGRSARCRTLTMRGKAARAGPV